MDIKIVDMWWNKQDCTLVMENKALNNAREMSKCCEKEILKKYEWWFLLYSCLEIKRSNVEKSKTKKS